MKVSIVIPNYNEEKYISQCVLSCLQQTHPEVEVIFADNQSTDNSVAIVKEIQRQYPQLIMDSAPNIYPHCHDECKEVGFARAKGDYLTIIGADDYLDPNYVAMMVKQIELSEEMNEEKVLAIQSPIRGIVDGKEIGDIGYYYYSMDEFKKGLLERCICNTPTVFYARELYDKGWLKTYPEIYSGAADYFLYAELADKGVMVVSVGGWRGYYYRWHNCQSSVFMKGKCYDKTIQEYWRKKWKL